MSNSELTKSLSRALATRLWDKMAAEISTVNKTIKKGGTRQKTRFVTLAFLQVLNRAPGEAERVASLNFLEQQTRRITPVAGTESAFDPAVRARENLVHALMNHNDFVTVR